MEAALYLPVVAALDPTVEIDPELLDRIEQSVRQNDRQGAAGLISDDILDLFAFAGNADDLIHKVMSIFEAGANRVEFGTPHGINQAEGIRILGENVIPALSSR